MKKIITKEERLQIHGIIALGQLAAKQMKECDRVLNDILEAGDDDTGCLNEEYFEDIPKVDKAIKKLGITIKK